MRKRVWGNEYRNTRVCIDSYEQTNPAGRIYHAALPQGQSFHSLTQFFVCMDRLLDEVNIPQSFTTARSFAGPHEAGGPNLLELGERPNGELATFMVRVLFRQNASWQGSVTWLEGEQEESFRSALELAFLMDSALTMTLDERAAPDREQTVLFEATGPGGSDDEGVKA